MSGIALARIWGNRNLISFHLPGLLSILSYGWRKLDGPLICAHNIMDLGEFNRHGHSYQPIMPVGP